MKIILKFFTPVAVENHSCEIKASNSSYLAEYLPNMRLILVSVIFLVTDPLPPQHQGCCKFVTSALLLCPFSPATSSTYRCFLEHIYF